MEPQQFDVCDFPFYVDNPRFPIYSNERKVPVPCGKCPPCQARRTSIWTFRLLQEDKRSKTSLFVTFTYDTRYVPITKSGYMSLNKRDFQLFMKRLRKEHGKNHPKIRYYCAGEYGSKTFRPHYHAIIFDSDERSIAKCWQLGQIHFGKVSGPSIGYTCKYINKGKVIPIHAKDDRIPEFSLMSKGMGVNYLTPQIIAWHRQDLTRLYLTLEDGIKICMPRYYRERIWNESERRTQAELIAVRMDEEENQRQYEYYLSNNYSLKGYEQHREQAAKYRLERHRKRATENRKSI